MQNALQAGLLLSALLTLSACGQTDQSASVDRSERITVQGTPTVIDQTTPWFEGLARLGEAYPAFAGYEVDTGTQTVTLLVAKKDGGRSLSPGERGNKLGLIRQNFQRLMDTTQAMPLDGEVESISGVTWKFRFRDVTYSLKDLNGMQRALESSTLKWGSAGLNMSGNRLAVRLDTEAEVTGLHAMGQARGMEADVFDVTIGRIIPGGTNNVSAYNPAPGGVKVLITNSSTGTTGASCTLGLPVVVGGITGFLTAAHCAQPIGTDTDLFLRQAGVTIGQEQNDPAGVPQTNGYNQHEADVVFFKSYANYSQGILARSTRVTGSHTTLRDANNQELYYRVTNTVLRPGQGLVLENLGATAGYRQATTTANVNVTTNFPSTNPPVIHRGMVEVSSTDPSVGAGCQGDSGSPWYRVNADGTTATFYGIQSSLSSDFTHSSGNLCGYKAYFSPVEQIERAFGAGNVNYKN